MDRTAVSAFIGPHKRTLYLASLAIETSSGSAGKRELSVALMPGSLLAFSGEAYEECLHGIDQARPLRTRKPSLCVTVSGNSQQIEDNNDVFVTVS